MTAPGPRDRLFLLDGNGLAYRAYYSFLGRPLVNSQGVNTGAVYGFVTTLLKILDDERPARIAVVFDAPGPTFRHEQYAEYKATRQKMPEDLAAQFALIKEVVRAFRVPVLEVPGVEADDVMGTLARRAEQEGIACTLVSADKDLLQLVSPQVSVYRPGKAGAEGELVTEADVERVFGVPAGRVVDALAIMGDSSDNVPGVAGIGPKTALPLLQKFRSLEEIYARLEEIPQKGTREKLRSSKENAYLSRELVTIRTDVPLEETPDSLRASAEDLPAVLALFERLEFRSLARRMQERAAGGGKAGEGERPGTGEGERQEEQRTSGGGDISGKIPPDAGDAASLLTGAAAPPLQLSDISTTPHSYTCVTAADDLATLAGALRDAAVIAVDTETTATDPLRARLVGLSFCIHEGTAYYVPVRLEQGTGEGLFDTSAAGPGHTAAALDRTTVLDTLRPVLESPKPQKVGQNIKYDMLVLLQHGIELRGVVHDTMVASYILRPDGQHNLDALAREAFGYRMVSYQELTGKGKVPITDVPLDAVADYAAEDADFTMRMFRWQLPRLKEQGMLELCERVEFPLLPVLVRMEATGVKLDAEMLRGMSKELERLLEERVSEIHRHAGGSFNINSTQQLATVLFETLGLPTIRKTKTGFSTDVAVLEALRGKHPIIELLLEYRQLSKLKSTYVDALPSLINPATGRVHTSYNQTVAATGRLSSSDPNLQNIPIRTDLGREIRRAFIPDGPGQVILSADYSQIELRVMAHISEDEGLLQAFRNDEDIHATTAARVFGVAQADVTPLMRRKAKEVNFGIMYGIGPFGLANRLEISQTEAREIIQRYFERFPKVKQYVGDTIEGARRQGYVSTLLGRRRYLPDIGSRNQTVRSNAERQAINMPIQGTAADMIKLAMVRIGDQLAPYSWKARMILQVHDELVFEVPAGEVDRLTDLVRTTMREALPLRVPVKVDVGTGPNWLEAH